MKKVAIVCLLMAFAVGFVGCSTGPADLDMNEVMENQGKTLAGDGKNEKRPSMEVE